MIRWLRSERIPSRLLREWSSPGGGVLAVGRPEPMRPWEPPSRPPGIPSRLRPVLAAARSLTRLNARCQSRTPGFPFGFGRRPASRLLRQGFPLLSPSVPDLAAAALKPDGVELHSNLAPPLVARDQLPWLARPSSSSGRSQRPAQCQSCPSFKIPYPGWQRLVPPSRRRGRAGRPRPPACVGDSPWQAPPPRVTESCRTRCPGRARAQALRQRRRGTSELGPFWRAPPALAVGWRPNCPPQWRVRARFGQLASSVAKVTTTGLWSLRASHSGPAAAAQDRRAGRQDAGTKRPSQW
jgi:hypothetical protein